MQIINFYQKIEEPLSTHVNACSKASFLKLLESMNFFGALLKLICTFKSLAHASWHNSLSIFTLHSCAGQISIFYW